MRGGRDDDEGLRLLPSRDLTETNGDGIRKHRSGGEKDIGPAMGRRSGDADESGMIHVSSHNSPKGRKRHISCVI